MANKTRKRILRVPQQLPIINTDVFKEKEIDLTAEEQRKQEELKERAERLKKFKEAEQKKLEEIERLEQEQLRKLDNKIEHIKTYKVGDTDQPVYGAFLENANKDEDSIQVKVYDSIEPHVIQSKPCETFEYAAVDTAFQESLMEFFKDIPAVINEANSVALPKKVEKIIMEAPKEIKKAESPSDFTKNVKALIDERKNINNPVYVKPEAPAPIAVKPLLITEQLLCHRTDTVVSSVGRARGPTSRTSSRLSDYKRGA